VAEKEVQKEEQRRVNEQVAEAVKSMSEFTALLYYYLTKEIMEACPENGKEIIKRAIRGFGLHRGKAIAEKVKAKGLPPTIENLQPNYDMPIIAGWEPNLQQRPNGEWYGQTDECTFANVWRELGHLDIGRLYCDVDIALREGYNPDIEYVPQTLIPDGDKYCSSISRYKKRECSGCSK
jgi:hypothetical protein